MKDKKLLMLTNAVRLVIFNESILHVGENKHLDIQASGKDPEEYLKLCIEALVTVLSQFISYSSKNEETLDSVIVTMKNYIKIKRHLKLIKDPENG
jgi:hypothetical protein